MVKPPPISREQLSLHLKEQGFRLTPQREKILDIFFNLPEGEHLSADELHHQLKNQHGDISLATSYRTLKLLASVGVLRELDFAEDHKHYELTRDPDSPHHHIICIACGRTEEFEAPEALKLAVNIAEKTRFKLSDVQLKVFGLCHFCQTSDSSTI